MVDWRPLSYGLTAPLTTGTRPALLVAILVQPAELLGVLPYIGCLGLFTLPRVVAAQKFEEVEDLGWAVTLPNLAPYSSTRARIIRWLGFAAVPVAGVIAGFPLFNSALLVLSVLIAELGSRWIWRRDNAEQEMKSMSRQGYLLKGTFAVALIASGPTTAALLGYSITQVTVFYLAVAGVVTAVCLISVGLSVQVARQGHTSP